PLRRVLLEESAVDLIETYTYPVFEGVSVDVAVTVLERGAPDPEHKVSVSEATSPGKRVARTQIPQRLWAKEERAVMDLSGDVHTRTILAEIDAASIPMGEVAGAYFGLQTHDRDTFVADESRGPRWVPCIDGGNINRYYAAPPEQWVHITDEAIKSGGDMSVHGRDRIGVRQIGRRPIAALVPGGWVTLNTIYNVYVTADEALYDRRYLLAVMSSSLVGWYWAKRFSDHKRSFPKVKKAALLGIPIPPLDAQDARSLAHRDAILAAVDEALAAREALATTDDPEVYDALFGRAKQAEASIDMLVLDAFQASDEVRAALE
ncbi:MAG: TaqI-like C-terminal specificity domain-containing protein, partial [Myxococcota bacterium]